MVRTFCEVKKIMYTKKQGVQGLQAFAFCVLTVNNKHMERRFKRKRRG